MIGGQHWAAKTEPPLKDGLAAAFVVWLGGRAFSPRSWRGAGPRSESQDEITEREVTVLQPRWTVDDDVVVLIDAGSVVGLVGEQDPPHQPARPRDERQRAHFRDEADYISKYRRVLDHFDAVKIGLTATPALHTTEIFGRPVYPYSYREAVIDGWLIDHEPPLRIVTALAEDGITWTARRGDGPCSTRAPARSTPSTLPDEVDVRDRRASTRAVVTENFNRVVCDASWPDTSTRACRARRSIFCATDDHADLVVLLLKEALRRRSTAPSRTTPSMKITGAADKPLAAHPPLQERAQPEHRRHRGPADHRHRRAGDHATSSSCAGSQPHPLRADARPRDPPLRRDRQGDLPRSSTPSGSTRRSRPSAP